MLTCSSLPLRCITDQLTKNRAFFEIAMISDSPIVQKTNIFHPLYGFFRFGFITESIKLRIKARMTLKSPPIMTVQSSSILSLLKTLYLALVRSQLEFCSVVWSPYTSRNITKLERMQRRATKLILKTNDDYEIQNERLNLLKQQRRFMLVVLFLYKILNGYINMDIILIIVSWYINKTTKYKKPFTYFLILENPLLPS